MSLLEKVKIFTAKFAKDLRKERKELIFNKFIFANFAISLRLRGKKYFFEWTQQLKIK